MMFIAIKTKDGVIKGKLSFYCRMLGVSRQGFYKYLAIKDRPWKYQDLADAMRVIHAEDECNDTYGRIRMYQALLLKNLEGLKIPSERTVYRVMDEIGLSHRPKRKPNGITRADREARKSDDLLKRDFKSNKPLEKCVTDITEIKAKDGKLYVSAIFDCFDSSVLGLAMETNMKATLCEHTLDNAYLAYPNLRGAILHSDRGRDHVYQVSHGSLLPERGMERLHQSGKSLSECTLDAPSGYAGKSCGRSLTMKIIEPCVELVNAPSYPNILSLIEQAGRTCYKSESKITEDSAEKFVRNILKRGHEAVIEHGIVTVRFICDRGVSHEIVRHRLASYCQESTRYCNYSKEQFGTEITVISPAWTSPGYYPYTIWKKACSEAEENYFTLLDIGCSPQEARSVLPNSLKTEVVMTANLREWRHFIKLRTAPAAHPDMRRVARMLYDLLSVRYPVFFEDIEV